MIRRQINAATEALIKSFETLRLVAFRPTQNDVWTIGWGHTTGVKEGDTCTPAQAEAWFLADVAWACLQVQTHCKIQLTDNQFGALVSISYNIGAGNFDSSTLLKDLNANDVKDAAAQFLVWDKQRGQVLEGLERRREAEKALFETP